MTAVLDYNNAPTGYLLTGWRTITDAASNTLKTNVAQNDTNGCAQPVWPSLEADGVTWTPAWAVVSQ